MTVAQQSPLPDRPPANSHWFVDALVVFVLLVVGFLLGSFDDLWRLARLERVAVSVPAKITASTIDASGRYAVDVIDYRFELPGRSAEVSGQERFQRGPCSDLTDGALARAAYSGDLRARFLPDAPEVNCLDIEVSQRLRRACIESIGWGVAVLLCSGGFAIYRRLG
jgi:hypothetical protein